VVNQRIIPITGKFFLKHISTLLYVLEVSRYFCYGLEQYYITFEGAVFERKGGYIRQAFNKKVNTYVKVAHLIILTAAAIWATTYYVWNIFFKTDQPQITIQQIKSTAVPVSAQMPLTPLKTYADTAKHQLSPYKSLSGAKPPVPKQHHKKIPQDTKIK